MMVESELPRSVLSEAYGRLLFGAEMQEKKHNYLTLLRLPRRACQPIN
jgi:hypothetical protein